MATMQADQLLVWTLVVGSIAAWVVAVVIVWRTRRR